MSTEWRPRTLADHCSESLDRYVGWDVGTKDTTTVTFVEHYGYRFGLTQSTSPEEKLFDSMFDGAEMPWNMRDLLQFGVSVSRNGVRVDPTTMYFDQRPDLRMTRVAAAAKSLLDGPVN